MAQWFMYLLVSGIAYLLGSISTGLIVARLMKGPNLRQVGSGNTGATNVTRTMGWTSGLLTFAGDCLKAVAACLIGRWVLGETGAMAAGLFAVIGHNWPLYYHFKGGKGAASSVGVMLVTFPVQAFISYAVAILTIVITRYVSLGSLLLVTLFAVLVIATHLTAWKIVLWSLLLCFFCFYRHKANIKRLLSGTENRFSVGKKK